MANELNHPARAHFLEMPAGRVFLNSAYMSRKPKVAIESLHETVDRLACPDFAVEEFFEPLERVRARLARLVGGTSERMSLTGSASYGTATLAWNLRTRAQDLVGTRRRILGVDGQFPSNVQTWQHLEPFGFQLELVDAGPGATDRLIESLDTDVALLAIEPLSWTDGLRLDVPRLHKAAREAGALTLTDVTQSMGVDEPLPDTVDFDVVVGGGYKWLLGPYGTGFMRLSSELQEKLEPLEWNWKNFEGASDFNRLTEYQTAFASPAAKFDHGESSAFMRMAAWEKSLAVLEEITPAAIAAHTKAFGQTLAARMDRDRFTLSEIESNQQATHLFRLAPRDPADFDALSERLASQGLEVSRRAGGIRISPHVYNDMSHLDALVAAL